MREVFSFLEKSDLDFPPSLGWLWYLYMGHIYNDVIHLVLHAHFIRGRSWPSWLLVGLVACSRDSRIAHIARIARSRSNMRCTPPPAPQHRMGGIGAVLALGLRSWIVRGLRGCSWDSWHAVATRESLESLVRVTMRCPPLPCGAAPHGILALFALELHS